MKKGGTMCLPEDDTALNILNDGQDSETLF